MVQEIISLGTYIERGEKVVLEINQEDRRRHLYIIGETGTGKTTLLENMILEDIKNNRGVGVIDPHGDLIEKILNHIPKKRINETIYFNPSDKEYSFSFNPLKFSDNQREKELITSSLISVFKKQWQDSWGPRLEYILRNLIFAILDHSEPTILNIQRMLIDEFLRERIIRKIKDPIVKLFFEKEFLKYHQKFLIEAIAPIQNKIGQYLTSPLLRNILCQVKNKINPFSIINNQKIFLLNLSKGKIGEDNTNLLGSLIITQFQIGAMKRQEIKEKERKDFYFYIDEFQNFATESFIDILAEARKYRLNLIISHQCLNQIPEKIKSLILGNVGIIISFRLGIEDAEIIKKEFYPYHFQEELISLPNYNFLARVIINGKKITSPIRGVNFFPLSETSKIKTREKIIKISRERYAVKREIIEGKIKRLTKK